MIVEEIDKKLDMELSFSMSSKNPLAPFAEKFHIFSLSNWIFRNATFELYYIIPVSETVTNEMRMFLEGMGAMRKGDVWIVLRGAEVAPRTPIMKYLMDVESLVLNYSYLEGNMVNFNFRFHSLQTEKVSDAIMSVTENNVELKNLVITKGNGLVSLINFISQKTPLCYTRFIAEVSKPTALCLGNAVDYVWERETRFQTDNSGIGSLFYLEGNRTDVDLRGFSEISRKDGIFSSPLTWPMLDFYSKLALEFPIPVISRTQKFSRSSIFLDTILPVSNLDDHLRVANSTRLQFPDEKLTLFELKYL
ncbi:MAG: hypothetical protein ACYCT2_06180 [Thermoplasmataceae archaeon]